MSSTASTAQLWTVVAIAAASLGIGYAIGVNSVVARAAGKSNTSSSEAISTTEAKVPQKTVVQAQADDSDSDEEDVADGDLSSVKAGFLEQCKLVLVVRTDLKMTTGKIAAQCGHATLACYKALQKTNPQLLRHWEVTGQAKVALKAGSEDELLELEAIAKSLNLCARSICDAGRTQIAAGSRTVLGIGPAPVELVNRVTGKLRLL